MKNVITILMVLGFYFMSALTLDAQVIRYVKQDGTGDGSSWANASGDLQLMVDEVLIAPDKGEVRVAAGVYKGETLSMREGVNVFGGYPANGGDTRNPLVNQTILDGEHTRRVLHQNESGDQWVENTIWDGFVIQNGRAQYGAGAVICLRGILRNCVIRNNHATGENQWRQGGGVMMKKTTGAIHNRTGLLINCIIVNNTADDNGGGVFFGGSSTGSVINCVIANNEALGLGAGGIHMASGSRWSEVRNSILWGNFGPAGYQMVSASGEKQEAKKNNCIEYGLEAENFNEASCTDNIVDDPQFMAATSFLGATTDPEEMAELYAADWNLQNESPCVDAGSAGNLVIAQDEQEAFSDWLVTDIIGGERISGDAVDIGAFEKGVASSIANKDAVSFEVSPNPVIGMLMLNGLNEGDLIQVLNMTGSIIIENIANSNVELIEMSSLQQGAYFVVVTRNGETMVSKVIKK